METNKKYTIKNQENLPNSEIEIYVESPEAELKNYRTEALKNMLAEAEMDGFRKGKVPEEIFLKRYGESAVLYEASGLLIRTLLPEILSEVK